MIEWMGVINLTPDSFFEPSRADASTAMSRIKEFVDAGASIIDLGAVSTRPGGEEVPLEEEWRRLEPVLKSLGSGQRSFRISIDTTSAEIIRRAYDVIGPFIANDISSGEDDTQMLSTVAELGLTYIAMHKRGTPKTMDSLTEYDGGVMLELVSYFRVFAHLAESVGIRDWILDPGLGFAKTPKQDWEILQRLAVLESFGKPILVGTADKRFTHHVPSRVARWFGNKGAAAARQECFVPAEGFTGTDIANTLAADRGATILRVHEMPNIRK